MRKSIFICTIVLLLSTIGCTSYSAKIGDAEIDMVYFLQDKSIKSLVFDPINYTIKIEQFGSETSQVVEAIAEAIK